MKYLLDTDIIIPYLKDQFGLTKKILEVGIDNCFVSEITIAELTYGAYKSTQFEKHLAEAKSIEKLFTVLSIYDNFAAYAAEKTRLQKIGKLIPDFDLLIATTAVNQNMVMITKNQEHFERIEGIQIENWSLKSFNQFV